MSKEKDDRQIIRKDAKNCFVEILNDSFKIDKIHLNFATYDTSKPKGKRQTNNVAIYLPVDEFLEITRQIECGEMKFELKKRRDAEDGSPIYESLGGTSAERLKSLNAAREDGKSISRIFRITCGKKGVFLTAVSGPGEENEKGLIVPKYKEPENRVSVCLPFEMMSEMFLVAKIHYSAWLAAKYVYLSNNTQSNKKEK